MNLSFFLLILSIVGEMHILIVLVNLGGICLTSEFNESCQTLSESLLEYIDSQRFIIITCDEEVDSGRRF